VAIPANYLGVFIDYDNLTPIQKNNGIFDLLTKVLCLMPGDLSDRVWCDIRIYGGWYEETQMTRMAQDVAVEIQRDFPSIIRLPTNGRTASISVVVNAELAVALLQEPGHHLFNTFRRKGKPSNIRVETPNNVGCTDAECILPLMNTLIKAGRCPKPGCSGSRQNLIYRNEQKIVDTMLSCDLIHGGVTKYDAVILISGDDDFLPPLRTVLLHGTPAIRFHPKPNCARASFPQGGANFIEMDI
jgi:uncharacterized LabA/DUF88 family protein